MSTGSSTGKLHENATDRCIFPQVYHIDDDFMTTPFSESLARIRVGMISYIDALKG
jgi:hypothetical protein